MRGLDGRAERPGRFPVVQVDDVARDAQRAGLGEAARGLVGPVPGHGVAGPRRGGARVLVGRELARTGEAPLLGLVVLPAQRDDVARADERAEERVRVLRRDRQGDLAVYRGLQCAKRDGAVAAGRKVQIQERRLVGEVEVGSIKCDDARVAAVGLDVVGDARQVEVDARHAFGQRRRRLERVPLDGQGAVVLNAQLQRFFHFANERDRRADGLLRRVELEFHFLAEVALVAGPFRLERPEVKRNGQRTI